MWLRSKVHPDESAEAHTHNQEGMEKGKRTRNQGQSTHTRKYKKKAQRRRGERRWRLPTAKEELHVRCFRGVHASPGRKARERKGVRKGGEGKRRIERGGGEGRRSRQGQGDGGRA